MADEPENIDAGSDGEPSLEALTGNVESRELEKEMRSSYLDYAMSVIVGRALPDVRDGLKPVHRRVLYAMHDLGLQPNRPYRKCAFIVGEVMGKYHPHGDSAIYDTLVRMAQEFSLRYPLVDGQGNFGSIDGDTAAAMRYTEARLGPLATQMLRDIDAQTVDFGPNYDERTQEPLLLPARFPNLLVNGAAGIAVGMATNIPPHNLPEVAGAVNAFIDDPDIDLKGLMKHVKGPDFPGGGTILGTRGHPRRIRLRPRVGEGPCQGARRADEERQGVDHHHRAPVPGPKGRRGRSDHEDRRPGAREEDHRNLGPARRVGPLGDARRDRAEARRRPGEGRAEPALQAHPDAAELRHQHGRARRRRPEDAEPAGDDPPLRRPPARRHHPPHPAPALPGRGARPHPRGTAHRARQPRRGHQADPEVGRPRRGARRPDGQVRAEPAAGPGDPRHAPPEADGPRGRQDQGGARRAHEADQGAQDDPRRRVEDPRDRQGRAVRDLRSVRRRAANRDRRRRGRDGHRGHDRRPADGDFDHLDRLREAPAARDLPPAAPRRHAASWG